MTDTGHGGPRRGAGRRRMTEEEKAAARAARAARKASEPAQPRRQIVLDGDALERLFARINPKARRLRRENAPFYFDPTKLHPPQATPPKEMRMAMDQCPGSAWASGEWTNFAGTNGGGFGAKEGVVFLGFPYLAELAQRTEFRQISETIADDSTRKWIDFEVAGTKEEIEARSLEDAQDPAGKQQRRMQRLDDHGKLDKVQELKDEIDRLKLRDAMYNTSRDDGFFGRSHVFMDFGDDVEGGKDAELATPIGDGRNEISRSKIKRGSLRAIRTIEPVWTYPMAYNAINPLRDDWYRPQVWYVLGKQIHISRMPIFIGHPVPDLLKPAYSFGGISLTQLALTYVDIWLDTRQSVAQLIRAFSIMVLSTDLAGSMQPTGGLGGAEMDIWTRIGMFNAMRDNAATFVINKETEEFSNVSAPLSGLHELQAQAQEHICSAVRIPVMKFTGISPTGMNASSEGEIRAYYDTIAAYQNRFFRPNLTKILDFIMLSLWGEVDEDITFVFEDLWEMSEKERAELQKTEAERDQIFVDGGAISNGEWRERIVDDPHLPFADLDPTDVPDLLSEEQAGLVPEGAGRPVEEVIGQGEGGEGGGAPGGGGAPEGQKKPGLASTEEDEIANFINGGAADMAFDSYADAFEAAGPYDQLGYLRGVKAIHEVPDQDQWNATYTPQSQTITIQGKFDAMDAAEQVRTMLHEGGHHGQTVDKAAFDDFVDRGLGDEAHFVPIANAVHRCDFEKTGKVDGVAGEAFAESYARACLGLPLPEDLESFWKERFAAKQAHDANWEESKHKRGQPENAGQFGPGGGGGGGSEKGGEAGPGHGLIERRKQAAKAAAGGAQSQPAARAKAEEPTHDPNDIFGPKVAAEIGRLTPEQRKAYKAYSGNVSKFFSGQMSRAATAKAVQAWVSKHAYGMGHIHIKSAAIMPAVHGIAHSAVDAIGLASVPGVTFGATLIASYATHQLLSKAGLTSLSGAKELLSTTVKGLIDVVGGASEVSKRVAKLAQGQGGQAYDEADDGEGDVLDGLIMFLLALQELKEPDEKEDDGEKTEPAKDEGEPTMSKAKAGYQERWPQPKSQCRRCSMFVRGSNRADINACTLVIGDISAYGHCTKFAPKTEANDEALDASGDELGRRIVRNHYGLNRPVTSAELQDEIKNIQRRGLGNLDNDLEHLAASLDVFGRNPYGREVRADDERQISWFDVGYMDGKAGKPSEPPDTYAARMGYIQGYASGKGGAERDPWLESRTAGATAGEIGKDELSAEQLEKYFRSYSTKNLKSHLSRNDEMKPEMRAAIEQELKRRGEAYDDAMAHDAHLVTTTRQVTGQPKKFFAVEFERHGKPFLTNWTSYPEEARSWQESIRQTGWSSSGRPTPHDLTDEDRKRYGITRDGVE